jgi:hypothetical protein
LRNSDDWEGNDAGIQYIWSEKAVRVLTGLGLENWHAVIVEVDAAYRRERSRGTVRDPERLARTMVRYGGLTAMRACSIQEKGRRRPILREPIERQDLETGETYSHLEVRPSFHARAADEAFEELRGRLRREDEQADHRSQLEHMRRRLGQRLVGGSDLACPLHERTCPRPAKVLAATQSIVTSLGNALDEQETGDWEQVELQRRNHHTRTRLEWDQWLHQRLIHLATDAAFAEDPVMYDNSSGGRQARARVARCILHALWLEAKAVDFKYLAEQVRQTLGWVYTQQLRRQGISAPTRERLLGWFQDQGELPSNPRETGHERP